MAHQNIELQDFSYEDSPVHTAQPRQKLDVLSSQAKCAGGGYGPRCRVMEEGVCFLSWERMGHWEFSIICGFALGLRICNWEKNV